MRIVASAMVVEKMRPATTKQSQHFHTRVSDEIRTTFGYRSRSGCSMFVGIRALEGAFTRKKGKSCAERDNLHRISISRLG